MINIKLFKDNEKEKQQFHQEAKKRQNIENKRKLVNQLVVIQIFRLVAIENMFQQEITTNGPVKGKGSICFYFRIESYSLVIKNESYEVIYKIFDPLKEIKKRNLVNFIWLVTLIYSIIIQRLISV